MATPHMWNEKTTLNNEAKKQNALVFLLCGGLCNYENIRTSAKGDKNGFLNQRVQHCEHLLWVGILYT